MAEPQFWVRPAGVRALFPEKLYERTLSVLKKIKTKWNRAAELKLWSRRSAQGLAPGSFVILIQEVGCVPRNLYFVKLQLLEDLTFGGKMCGVSVACFISLEDCRLRIHQEPGSETQRSFDGEAVPVAQTWVWIPCGFAQSAFLLWDSSSSFSEEENLIAYLIGLMKIMHMKHLAEWYIIKHLVTVSSRWGTRGNVRDKPCVKPPIKQFGADRDKRWLTRRLVFTYGGPGPVSEGRS